MQHTANPAEIRSQFSHRESHIAEISYITSGDELEAVVTVDCPKCECSGYTAEGGVCDFCFGGGDITLSDLEEIASILDLWS